MTREERAKCRARVLVPWFAALLLGTAGCGTVNWTLQRQIAAEARDLTPAVEDDAATLRLATDTAEHGLPPPDDAPLPDDAGLDDYVRLTLRDNPAIGRAVRQLQVLGYQVPAGHLAR